jgi:hypothetical protein
METSFQTVPIDNVEIDDDENDPTVPIPQTASRNRHRSVRAGTEAFIPHDILKRPSLVSLATRLKMTPTQQAAFTRGLIEESGGSMKQVSTSYATADRSRRKILEDLNVERHAQWTPPPLCTLHWDGKLTHTLTNVRETEELLTVVVGNSTDMKLLGVPGYMKKTDEATGTIIARLTFKLLQEWNCINEIVNLAFDTTASNTGHISAACICIQLKLQRPLLWSGCRHHIGEVFLTQIFNDLKFEASRSPEVTLFVHLRDNWCLIPHEEADRLRKYVSNQTELPFLHTLRTEFISCASGMLTYKRGDYREFVELCLAYIGATQTPIKFQRPGALHKARWMAKLLYILKLALLEDHISLLPQGTVTTMQQTPKIRAFADFIVHIYATWWLSCDKAVDAAWNDLKLYKTLCEYKAVHSGIASSAIKALERHLWYLTGEMLPLALFSDKVPTPQKQALAAAILESKPSDLPMSAPEKRQGTGFGKPVFPNVSEHTQLSDLANNDCWFGIYQLQVDPAFLTEDPEHWPENPAYQASLKNIQGINVVNDCAERGVKLTSDFVDAARSEPHLQNVLQAVEYDRKTQPNLRSSIKRKL